jgi:hypothetical protein
VARSECVLYKTPYLYEITKVYNVKLSKTKTEIVVFHGTKCIIKALKES